MSSQRTQGFVLSLEARSDPGQLAVTEALRWLQSQSLIKAVLFTLKPGPTGFQLTILIRAKNTIRPSSVQRLRSEIVSCLPSFDFTDVQAFSSQRALALEMANDTRAIWTAAFPSLDVAMTRFAPPRGGYRGVTSVVSGPAEQQQQVAQHSSTPTTASGYAIDEEDFGLDDEQAAPSEYFNWFNRLPRISASWESMQPINISICIGPQPEPATEPIMDRIARDVSELTSTAARKRALRQWDELACRPHVWPSIAWVLARNSHRHQADRWSADNLLTMFNQDTEHVGLVWPKIYGMPLGITWL